MFKSVENRTLSGSQLISYRREGLDVCAKKGEVVEPAGGETGMPRCLAEVRKLLKAALFHYLTYEG